jgi:hypothetical protein
MDLDETIRVVEYLTGESVTQRCGRIYARCPLHAERTPSFEIHTGSRYPAGTAHCFGACAAHFGSAHFIVLAHLYGIADSYTAEQHKAADTWMEGIGIPKHPHQHTPRLIRPEYLPSQEDKRFLKAILQYANQHMSRRARQVWEARKLPGYTRYVGCIAATDSTFFRTLQQISDQWFDLAYRLGFLYSNGTLRMADRLLVWTEDAEGWPTFYQGRALSPYQEIKYIGAPGWAPTGSLLLGTGWPIHVVEGVIDGWTLHQQGQSVFITWGSSNINRLVARVQELARAGRPIIFWQDPNEAGKKFVLEGRKVIPSALCADPRPWNDPNHWWVHDPQTFHSALEVLHAHQETLVVR